MKPQSALPVVHQNCRRGWDGSLGILAPFLRSNLLFPGELLAWRYSSVVTAFLTSSIYEVALMALEVMLSQARILTRRQIVTSAPSGRAHSIALGAVSCAVCGFCQHQWFAARSLTFNVLWVFLEWQRDARRGRLCRSSVDMSRRSGSHPCRPFHVSDAAGRIQRMTRLRVYPRRQSSHEQAGSVYNYHV